MTAPFNAAYTFPQHRISVTDNLRAGNALSAANQLTGVPVSLKQFENLGAVAVAATNNILTATPFAGAGSVAPNATPAGGSLVGGVATVDFPRTLQMVSSNAGDTTQTITITGTDYYGAPMTQAVALNGTTPVFTKKAFYTINNIASSAALVGNLTVGTDAKLGLSYCLLTGSLVVGTKNVSGTITADAGTVVQPDATSPATSLTGDVRGTYAPAAAENAATTTFYVEYQTLGGPLNTSAFGQPQA
jgi:hypothetical protein